MARPRGSGLAINNWVFPSHKAPSSLAKKTLAAIIATKQLQRAHTAAPAYLQEISNPVLVDRYLLRPRPLSPPGSLGNFQRRHAAGGRFQGIGSFAVSGQKETRSALPRQHEKSCGGAILVVPAMRGGRLAGVHDIDLVAKVLEFAEAVRGGGRAFGIWQKRTVAHKRKRA